MAVKFQGNGKYQHFSVNMRETAHHAFCAISHNMDNVEAMGQGDLNRYMGLTGGTDNANATAGTDASGSKTMTVNNNTITYEYQRGGVTLIGTINTSDQTVTWQIRGVPTGDQRLRSFAEGLKIPETSLTVTT